ncbi:helix-turn-helix domain-containing protein [Nocardia sp. CDC159]|uniref:Helix-turn-helix domain-containing protein n=1 Tax=Nocardia pulmonis TaxID=2951408 RepID=A0A9X2IZN4_9NOCA|nr:MULTISPECIES: helix-turn-helix domain-containing protein [Nocardia]MCM6776230.1 helix-turn-helix domain-containing protein [Nocardia pulmonis]MCM6788444.1 helix-turn-helix domain-containing protein [Nocardia sp. CDC159]
MAANAREAGWFTRAVASQLRAQLGVRKLRQADLVRATGIPKATLSSLLSGDTAIDLEQMRKIANALGIEVADIWTAAEQQGDPDVGGEDIYLADGTLNPLYTRGVPESDKHIEELVKRRRSDPDG